VGLAQAASGAAQSAPPTPPALPAQWAPPALPAHWAPPAPPPRRALVAGSRTPPTGEQGRAGLAATRATNGVTTRATNGVTTRATNGVTTRGDATTGTANVWGARRVAPIAEPTGAAGRICRQAPVAGAVSRGGARTRSRGPTTDLQD
jgi:hypothetical protein